MQHIAENSNHPDPGSTRPRPSQPSRSAQAAMARASLGQPAPTARAGTPPVSTGDTISFDAADHGGPGEGVPCFAAWAEPPQAPAFAGPSAPAAPAPEGPAAPAAPAPATPSAQPGEVPTGQLNYYRQRAEDFERRNPGQKPPDYYLQYGDKYAHAFTNLKPDLSPDGQKWVDKTLKNLQDQIEAKRRENPQAFAQLERDPEAFKKFCYGTHPSAYLNSGLAHLPPADLLKIASTPDFKDLLGKDGLGPALQTTVGALGQNPVLAVSVPFELSPVGILLSKTGLNPFD